MSFIKNVTKDHFAELFAGRLTSIYREKIDKIEEFLQQALQCKTWNEITANTRVEYHQSLSSTVGSKEIYYYGTKKILTVQQSFVDNKITYQYRNHLL